ncbi:AIR synthase family protein [Youngiibacter multivorans]|uniref:Hydrogenase expression/formation protein HypE n=1 Tax=Youngiibacter multivorans TaxID=937251 RepID=A0ABS4G6N2_9CLOT|nr:AIR synthase family protein [Youngiibacter multivorans]MBP1920184.1 hydrogenase expression/formation protein HypE [Youngiibacter multivorans]
METGKLNWDILQRLIKKNSGAERAEVLKSGSIGEDCAVLKMNDGLIVMSTDPVTAATNGLGNIALHININDIATTGAEPLGVLVTILAPKGSTFGDIETVMKDISREARLMNVQVMGGHTEVTDAVNRMVVSLTAVGVVSEDELITTSGAKVGDSIIVTKSLCLEGTSIIAKDFAERSREVLTEEELKEAENYALELSVLKEGMLLKGLASSMHDITEGGVLGALWEMAQASSTGFSVREDLMPVRRLTRKLCENFGLDPLRLISSGSMLVAVKDADEAVRRLEGAGIAATVIGKVTEARGILLAEEEIEVIPPARDEIYRLYD